MPIERLRQRKEFLAVAASGYRWVRPAFVLQYLPPPEPKSQDPAATARLGFTVSKKCDKRAVVRNRIRRRLKEAARLALPEVLLPGSNYVLLGRVAARDLSFDKLKLELAEAAARVQRLKQPGGERPK